VQRRGEVTVVGPLAAIDGLGVAPARAPRPGEHTRAILAEAGVEDSVIAAALAGGAAA
jgi:crotonobetainyl-CoA:carnitine CoA-transferase CaiB-like acyl-CoA transferase